VKGELTVKQEKYVQGLFLGLSQRAAYKQAYDAQNMTDKSIDEKACELSANVKIKSRLKELTDAMTIRNILTKEWVLERLEKVAERCMSADSKGGRAESGTEVDSRFGKVAVKIVEFPNAQSFMIFANLSACFFAPVCPIHGMIFFRRISLSCHRTLNVPSFWRMTPPEHSVQFSAKWN